MNARWLAGALLLHSALALGQPLDKASTHELIEKLTPPAAGTRSLRSSTLIPRACCLPANRCSTTWPAP